MLGPLRDVQVQLRTVEKLLPASPELQPFYDSLVKRQHKLVQQLTREVRAVKTGKVAKAIGAAIEQVEDGLATPESQREKWGEALRAAEAAFNRVVERKQAIEAADSASIHRMRVAFKKFRYSVESLSLLLRGVTRRQLKEMDVFQGQMGDIQDAEVLRSSLTAFARKGGAEREASLGGVLEALSSQHTALITAFMQSADRVYTFWKPLS
jgi:CHAD domain-containing protein